MSAKACLRENTDRMDISNEELRATTKSAENGDSSVIVSSVTPAVFTWNSSHE